jgi:hypothetical protein
MYPTLFLTKWEETMNKTVKTIHVYGDFRFDGTKEYVDILGKATLIYERSQPDRPKSYIPIGIINTPDRSVWEEGLITIFKNKKGILKFEIYHSGNFYPYYGTILFSSIKRFWRFIEYEDVFVSDVWKQDESGKRYSTGKPGYERHAFNVKRFYDFDEMKEYSAIQATLNKDIHLNYCSDYE